MPPHSNPDPGYSYIRFSHPEQSKGDSLRRQTEEAAQWCARNNVQLDTSTTLHDLGKSAYTGKHRQNPDRNALAAFLQLVERGKIPRGSYLIIENLDRLSREEEVPARHLLTSILMAGIRVVQLSPSELILTDKSPGWDIMRAVMELSRGHGESAIKSDRIGKAWRQKKKLARENGTLLTRRLPAWVEVRDGKLRLIPERAAVVRLIFELAIAGYGLASIVTKLTADGVPSFGSDKVKPGNTRPAHTAKWNRQYLSSILKDRRALGEHQPCNRDGTPDGPPIAGYFPAVVSEETWLAARAASEQRRRKPGRVSKRINVFAGLLKDARDGGTYYLTKVSSRKGNTLPVLLNLNGTEGRKKRCSFPFPTFEAAVLSHLHEIDPRELLDGVNGHDEVTQLEGEFGQLEKDIAALVVDLDTHGESPVLYARLRAKESRKAEVGERLAEAKRKAANPLSSAWAEAKSLIGFLDEAADKDDARLRLRAAIRRIVDSIWLLVVPRGTDRLAAVQVWFAGGERCRSYLILHRPPFGNATAKRPGSWWSRSLAEAALPDTFDLRKREHAEDLARALAELPLS
jgi:DNA invertase Pin-like site-specific DNA recombinase